MDSYYLNDLEEKISTADLQDILIQKDKNILELKKQIQEKQTLILELKQQITSLKLERSYSYKFPQPFPDVLGNFNPLV